MNRRKQALQRQPAGCAPLGQEELARCRARARCWCAVALALAAVGYVGCALAGLGHAWWLPACTATAGCAGLWQLVKWRFLCADARYLTRTFRLPLALGLACPVWVLLAAGGMALFTQGPPVEDLGYWLFVLVMMVLVPVAPVVALVLGVYAVVLGARHLWVATDADGRLYRELPLALSSFALVAVVALLGTGAVYLFA